MEKENSTYEQPPNLTPDATPCRTLNHEVNMLPFDAYTPETNIDTQNDGLENVSPLEYGHFWYLCILC